MASNFYSVLGVRLDATEREVRLAYRNKAKRFHPDRHAAGSPAARSLAERRMRDLNQAYEVLSSPQLRRDHDENLRAPPRPPPPDRERVVEQAAREALEMVSSLHLDEVAAKVVANQIRASDDSLLWEESQDEYFNQVLSTREHRTRVTVHVKVLPELNADAMRAVDEYSREILATTTASLLRWEFVYLLVGRTTRGEVALRHLAGSHNRDCWDVLSPLAPRAYLGWTDARDGRVHAPEVRRASPDLPGMKFRLKSLYA